MTAIGSQGCAPPRPAGGPHPSPHLRAANTDET
jgi:hypothetical protein